MKQAFSILSLLAAAGSVRAHGYVVEWSANGETQQGSEPGSSGGYSGIERPTDNGNWGPVDHTSSAAACGGASSGSGLKHWELSAGVEITAHWSGPDIFDTPRGEEVPTADRGNWPGEHNGPILEYMARCPGSSCDGVDASSLDWFKIGQASYDGVEWPTSQISRIKEWAFTIPSDIAPGPYLVRHELIALHKEPSKGGFEAYPYCVQVQLSGSGSAVPTDTTTFPAAYSPEQYKWSDYSIWDKSRAAGDYVPPGPAVYGGGESAGTPAPTAGGEGEESPEPSTSASSAPGGSETAPTGNDDEESGSPTTSAEGGEETMSSGGDDAGEEEEASSQSGSGSGSGATSYNPSPNASATSVRSSSRTRGRWAHRPKWTKVASTSVSNDEEEEEDEDEDDEDEE